MAYDRNQNPDPSEFNADYNKTLVVDPLNKKDVENIVTKKIENANEGAIANVLGLDSNGDLVKGAVSGGTKLYLHTLRWNTNGGSPSGYDKFISTRPAFTFVNENKGITEDDFNSILNPSSVKYWLQGTDFKGALTSIVLDTYGAGNRYYRREYVDIIAGTITKYDYVSEVVTEL